jgi:tetratricopeptide (TPR) repeat protein
MSVASGGIIHGRHPWLTRFESAPENALNDLLAGYADAHPYERADAPDAALMLFGPLGSEDPTRKKLEPAILSWLERRRKEAVPAARPKLQRRVREISEAFEIIALLQLADAAIELRRRFIIWNDWAARLVVSSARDARAEYWRMLALTQPLVATGAPDIARNTLMMMWQRVCREAGGRLPRHYLSIGLLGLRYLQIPDQGSELSWVSGLAQWALCQRPSNAEFKAEWLALKPLYPRSPSRWRNIVGHLLSAPQFRDAGIYPPGWWRIDPELSSIKRGDIKLLRSPMPEAAEQVIRELPKSFDIVEPHIDRLVADHRSFVYATGDSRYFVRAIHVVGTALLRKMPDEPHRRAYKVQELAREGLKWEPFSTHLWSLWVQALISDGSIGEAEILGWESIRRLPTEPMPRDLLALILARLPGRRDDAIALLRETITTIPNPHSARHLASLLVQSQYDEAIALLKDTVKQFPTDPKARRLLGSLLAKREGSEKEAIEVLQETVTKFPRDWIAQQQLAGLLAQFDERRGEAIAVLNETIREFPKTSEPRRQLASLLAKYAQDPERAITLLKETIQKFPKEIHAYKQLAGLLAQSEDHREEALALLKTARKLAPGDANVPSQMARVLSLIPGRRAEAVATLREAIERFPNSGAVDQLNQLLADVTDVSGGAIDINFESETSDVGSLSLSDEEEGEESATLQDFQFDDGSVEKSIQKLSEQVSISENSDIELHQLLKYGRLRRLSFRLAHASVSEDDNSVAEVQKILNEDPTFAYAQLLAARLRIWEAGSDTLPPFAAAFEQALAMEDRELLDELARRQPRLEALILVARSIFGDEESIELCNAWLRSLPTFDEEPATRTLRVGLVPVLRLIDGGRSPKEVFGDQRDLIINALHDANERTIGDPLLAA